MDQRSTSDRMGSGSLRLSSLCGVAKACAGALLLVIALFFVLQAPHSAVGIEPESAGPSGLSVATIVDADILSDTTWVKAKSPYQVTQDITVGPTATLSIEPGVEVRFALNGGLKVQGVLSAAGHTGMPITFTGETPQAGSWDGLSFEGTSGSPISGSILAHVTIEYGGKAYPNANLILQHATVWITDSQLRYSSWAGIYGQEGGVAHIYSSTFLSNTGYAIEFRDSSVNPALSDLSAVGNGQNKIALGPGTLQGEHVWENASLDYDVNGDIQVAASASLRIEPGVAVHFGDQRGLTALGSLTAIGTISQPITFTGQMATPGTWDGILLDGPAAQAAQLHYVKLMYGGRTFPNANLIVDNGATAVLKDAESGSSSGAGVYARQGGVLDIYDSTFTGNAGYAVYFGDGSVNPVLRNLTATGNGHNCVGLQWSTLRGEHVWERTGIAECDYHLLGTTTVERNSELSIEPGVRVRVEENRGLTVEGVLKASGTFSKPISFEGASASPWAGVRIEGSAYAPAVGSVLRHVVVRDGGGGGFPQANVSVRNGQVTIEHSRIISGSGDGVYIHDNGHRSVIACSEIVGNVGYGVYNRNPDTVVLAANNWWGSANGPVADSACNPGGDGSRISAGVAFSPFLKQPPTTEFCLFPSGTYEITSLGRVLYAPADGVTEVTVEITLRDGSGQPVSGRQVRLDSTLGTVQDGGVTDVQGRSYATVRSNVAGDAILTAQLDASTCEMARSAESKITFTEFDTRADLFPDAQAPYVNQRFRFAPRPIVRGVPSSMTVQLTNPNDFPISVNGTFKLAQYGIGMTFGPLGQVQEGVVPANLTRTFAISWTPLVEGHVCGRFEYSWRPVSTTVTALLRPSNGNSGVSGTNDEIFPGPVGSDTEKDSLEKAEEAMGFIGSLGQDIFAIPQALFSYLLGWTMKIGAQVNQTLGDDPLRQDYTVIATAIKPTVSLLQPGNGVSQERADALNALMGSMLDAIANGQAAVISLDRYAGAANARDLLWASQQTAALIHYKKEYGQAVIEAADNIEALLKVLEDENAPDVIVTIDDVRAYQERLRTQGYTAEEIEAARQLGLSDAEIEAVRQREIAAMLEHLSGGRRQRLAEAAAVLHDLGIILLDETTFPATNTTGARYQAQSTESVNLARVYETTVDFLVGNPLTETTTIELRTRRIDLPSDWSVTVTPITVTLSPGEQITATVRVHPASAVAQGLLARAAVEGYVNGELLGGIAIGVLVPQAVELDFGERFVYLPLVVR